MLFSADPIGGLPVGYGSGAGELVLWVFHREEKRVYPQISQIYTEVRKRDLEIKMRLPCFSCFPEFLIDF